MDDIHDVDLSGIDVKGLEKFVSSVKQAGMSMSEAAKAAGHMSDAFKYLTSKGHGISLPHRKKYFHGHCMKCNSIVVYKGEKQTGEKMMRIDMQCKQCSYMHCYFIPISELHWLAGKGFFEIIQMLDDLLDALHSPPFGGRRYKWARNVYQRKIEQAAVYLLRLKAFSDGAVIAPRKKGGITVIGEIGKRKFK